MIGIVVVGHGQFGSELVKTATQIAGQAEAIEGIDFLPHEGREDLLNKISRAIDKLEKGQGVILLTDLFGGCCCNVAASLGNKHRIKITSGVNLPMLLEVIFHRSQDSLDELEIKAIKGGVKGIIDVCEMLDKLSKKK